MKWPEGWQVKTLGEACTIKPPKAEARHRLGDEDLVSFAPMEELDVERKYLEPSSARRFSEVSGSYTYFADGDVLLAKITPCFENGKLGIARGLTNGVGFGSSEYIVFRPGPELYAEYLYYFLNRASFREEGAQRMAGAVGHKRVSLDFIESYTLPLPPLPEQRRIVAILDEAFEAIATAKANTERKLENARDVFESALSQVFSDAKLDWQAGTIGEHVKFIDYRGRTPEKTTSGIRLITAKNVKMGFLQEAPMEFVSPDSYDGWMTRGIPRAGDVLFTTEAPLGNIAQLDTEERVVFAQRVIIMQPDPAKIDRTFLKFMLMSGPLQAAIHARATGATAQGIKASLLKTIPIRFPSLRAQEALVNRFEGLLEESRVFAQLAIDKLTALDELKQSLLHQALTGHLTAKFTDKMVTEADNLADDDATRRSQPGFSEPPRRERVLKRDHTEIHLQPRQESERSIEVSSDDLETAGVTAADVLEPALTRFAKANPSLRATIYMYSTNSVSFRGPGYSDFLIVQGPAEAFDCVEGALSSQRDIRHRNGESISRRHGVPFLHIEDGLCWQREDSLTWYADAVNATSHNPASDPTRHVSAARTEFDMDKEVNSADDEAREFDPPPESDRGATEERHGRLRAARSDASIGTIRQTIEDLFGLPQGSVRLCDPDGRPLRADATIATLRRRWN